MLKNFLKSFISLQHSGLIDSEISKEVNSNYPTVIIAGMFINYIDYFLEH